MLSHHLAAKRLQAEIIPSHDYVCYWSMAGTAILEIDATLLTVRPPGEGRVWSKHFRQTYVGIRC